MRFCFYISEKYFIGGMFRSNWNRPSYSKVVQGDGGQGGGSQPSAGTGNGGQHSGTGNLGQSESGNAINSAALAMFRDDRIGRAETSKFLFQQRLKMEEKRRILAHGNMLTFLLDPSVPEKKSHMNRVLRVGGFEIADIDGVKLNDYRSNQAEVLFKSGVKIDIEDIEKRLENEKLNVIVSRFNDREDTFMVYGLPLSDNVDGLIKQIKRAIEPFVKRILEVTATKHVGIAEDDFFHNSYDGNFKVKVQPKENMQVPNFIVVGKDVCAKVVYKKTSSEKKQMCLNCYSTEHYRTDPLCPGPKDWDEFIQDFEEMWEKAALTGGEQEEVEDDQAEGDERCPRISSLVAKAKKLEIKEKEVESLKSQVDNLTKNFEDVEGLRKQLDVLSKEVQRYKELSEKAEEDEEFRSIHDNSENSVDMGSSTMNSEQSENSEATILSSDGSVVANRLEDEDPLSTSVDKDSEIQKRPRSSPGEVSKAKQGNVKIETGKIYQFSNGTEVKKGKVKSVSGKTVTIIIAGKPEKINMKKYASYSVVE